MFWVLVGVTFISLMLNVILLALLDGLSEDKKDLK